MKISSLAGTLFFGTFYKCEANLGTGRTALYNRMNIKQFYILYLYIDTVVFFYVLSYEGYLFMQNKITLHIELSFRRRNRVFIPFYHWVLLKINLKSTLKTI